MCPYADTPELLVTNSFYRHKTEENCRQLIVLWFLAFLHVQHCVYNLVTNVGEQLLS
jgi:hypothetical protein